ncbi:arsenate reductase ArsC [Roseovarius aestuariivivens]|uniref:arsenate reductase ArsC n=1 Tax=Roseovarius aestuariivivens TaxID=1888910 RepID=UPI001081B22C|nr:arsenate reductase ArsC [Roseovarius aestuariivivens]
MNILCLGTGNSARSILLETILNEEGMMQGIRAFSAGQSPVEKVNPHALKILEEKEYDILPLEPQSWDIFAGDEAPMMDIVITVCDAAAEAAQPEWPGNPVVAHWPVPDPSKASEAEQEKAVRAAYDLLNRRVEALLDLPFDNMEQGELKATLDRVAGQVT